VIPANDIEGAAASSDAEPDEQKVGGSTAQVAAVLTKVVQDGKITLKKTGERVELKGCRAAVDLFQYLSKNDPTRLRFLRDTVMGTAELEPMELIDAFQDLGFLDQSGRVRDQIRALLMATSTETGDGKISIADFDLKELFAPADPDEQQTLLRDIARYDQSMAKLEDTFSPRNRPPQR
jgi:hypothetical protein